MMTLMLTDALFLDSVAKVFEMGTSDIFLSHVRKFQSVYNEARRSVKKRIESKLRNLTVCNR